MTYIRKGRSWRCSGMSQEAFQLEAVRRGASREGREGWQGTKEGSGVKTSQRRVWDELTWGMFSEILHSLPSKISLTSACPSVLCVVDFILVQCGKTLSHVSGLTYDGRGCLQQEIDILSWHLGHWCCMERPASIRSLVTDIRSLVTDYRWITASASLLLCINFSRSR